jgi:hypothetical protein
MELACVEIDERLGRVIQVAEAQKQIGHVFARVRSDLQKLPYAVAADVAAMTDADEVRALLAARVEDALRHVALALDNPDA